MIFELAEEIVLATPQRARRRVFPAHDRSRDHGAVSGSDEDRYKILSEGMISRWFEVAGVERPAAGL